MTFALGDRVRIHLTQAHLNTSWTRDPNNVTGRISSIYRLNPAAIDPPTTRDYRNHSHGQNIALCVTFDEPQYGWLRTAWYPVDALKRDTSIHSRIAYKARTQELVL